MATVQADGPKWLPTFKRRDDFDHETLGTRAHTHAKMENYRGLEGDVRKDRSIRRDSILRHGAEADLKSAQGFIPWLESMGEVPPFEK